MINGSKSWDDLAGHAQTKYWLPRPDSFLATKLLKMSRKHLGFNIQFFSGHGWWRKHLMTAKLSKSDKCRLCLEDQAVKTPIHIFSECPERCYLMTPTHHNIPVNNLCVRSLSLPSMGLFKI